MARRVRFVLSVLVAVAILGASGCRRRARGPDASPPLPPIVVATVPNEPVPDGMPWVGDDGIDTYGSPHRTASPIGYRALLRARRFDQLTRYFDDLDRAAAEDFHRESWPIDALQAFDTADPTLTAPIDEWIRVHPESFAPYAARAQHILAAAWFFRGHETVDRAGAVRVDAAETLASDAMREVQRAFEHGPRSSAVARLAINTSLLARGGLGPLRARVEAALAACPGCYRIRYALLNASTPRWGGTADGMNALIAEARSHVAVNPHLAVIEGAFDHDRCNLPGPLSDRLSACDSALARGESADTLLLRAHVRHLMGDEMEALADVDHALLVRPAFVDAVDQRRAIDLALHRWFAAGEDALLGARLDPVGQSRIDSLQFAATMAAATAYVQHLFTHDGAARTTLELATRLDAHNAEAAAVGALVDGHDDPAVQTREAAVRMAPDDVDARRALDDALMAQGHAARVIALWDEYLERHPNDGRALFERAGTESHLRFNRDARNDARRACSLGHTPACGAVVHEAPREE